MSSTVNQLLTAAERVIDRISGVYKNAPPDSSNPDLVELGQKYNLHFVTDFESHDPQLSFDKVDLVQAHIFVDLLVSELSIYPRELISASKVERVVLCNHLRSNKQPVAGLAAMGLFMIDTLFLDASDITHGWDYARKAFHHELFHAIDYHDDIWRYLDTDWFHLNAEGFQYDRSLFKGFNEDCDRDGFVSTYSMTSIHEDKAEVYCNLIVNYAALERRAVIDEILQRKLKRMKQLLQRFHDAFDDEFWHSIHERSKTMHARTHTEWKRSAKHHHGRS